MSIKSSKGMMLEKMMLHNIDVESSYPSQLIHFILLCTCLSLSAPFPITKNAINLQDQ